MMSRSGYVRKSTLLGGWSNCMFARTHAPCVQVSVCLSVSLPVLLARALFSPFLSLRTFLRVYICNFCTCIFIGFCSTFPICALERQSACTRIRARVCLSMCTYQLPDGSFTSLVLLANPFKRLALAAQCVDPQSHLHLCRWQN